MLVRPMRAADARALSGLAASESPGWDLMAELAESRSTLRVAVPVGGATPLAYSVERWLLPEIELLALATDPAARRRGAARALLDDLRSRATRAGGRRITLEVRSGNAPARALYASLGFRPFHLRPGYYRSSGEDALELELRLGPAQS